MSKTSTKTWQLKIKKILGSLGKGSLGKPAGGLDLVKIMMMGILQADSDHKTAAKAISAIEREFVDLNELRVATPKDIIECIGRDYVYGREKAERLIRSINIVFDKTCTMSMDYMLKMGKRELAEHLMEIGLGDFAAAYVLLEGFGENAVPVDQSLIDALVIEAIIPPDTESEKIRDLLEKMAAPKSGKAAHKALRTFVDKHAKAIKKLQDQRAEEQAKMFVESHGRMRASEDISFPDEGFYGNDDEANTSMPEEMADDRSELLDSSTVPTPAPKTTGKEKKAATKPSGGKSANKAPAKQTKPAAKPAAKKSKPTSKPVKKNSKPAAKPSQKNNKKKKR